MTEATRPPHEGASAASVTTREQRQLALACAGIKQATSSATVAWLVEGRGQPTCAFAFEMAQALASTESRVRAESAAELERVKRELAEANAGLAQYAADIEGLGVPDAPWPETLEAIKAAMRIEKGATVTDEQLADLELIWALVLHPGPASSLAEAIDAKGRITAALAARGVK